MKTSPSASGMSGVSSATGTAEAPVTSTPSTLYERPLADRKNDVELVPLLAFLNGDVGLPVTQRVQIVADSLRRIFAKILVDRGLALDGHELLEAIGGQRISLKESRTTAPD